MKLTMRPLRTAAALALCALFAGPAAAGEIFAWRTDDGSYAYADDEKNIPARYRERAVRQETGRLHDYARFTSKDAAATERYERDLAERLAHLRLRNASREALPHVSAGPPKTDTMSLRLGGEYAPTIGFGTGNASEPVVVEKIRMRPKGQMATRHNTIVRRGDEVLVVIKGNLTVENSPSLNVMEERDLD